MDCKYIHNNITEIHMNSISQTDVEAAFLDLNRTICARICVEHNVPEINIGISASIIKDIDDTTQLLDEKIGEVPTTTQIPTTITTEDPQPMIDEVVYNLQQIKSRMRRN